MITVNKVKKLFANINENLDASDLKEDVKLSDQGIESLDTFDFFLQIEEEYEIEVSDDKIIELNTIQKIVEYINAHK